MAGNGLHEPSSAPEEFDLEPFLAETVLDIPANRSLRRRWKVIAGSLALFGVVGLAAMSHGRSDHLSVNAGVSIQEWGGQDIKIMNRGEVNKFDGTCYNIDKKVSLCLQKDGNLVVYQLCAPGDSKVIWDSKTDKHPDGNTLEFQQDDGNLVIYTPGHHTSGFQTGKSDAHELWLQDDCNLVLYGENHGKIQWSSNKLCNPKDWRWPVQEVEIMTPGQYLLPGNCTGMLGAASLCFQEDGNLVLYQDASPGVGRCKLWDSGEKHGAQKVVFQEDGNLVTLDQAGKAMWDWVGEGKGGKHLVLQADCNLVMYDGSEPRKRVTATERLCQDTCIGDLPEERVMRRGDVLQAGDNKCTDVKNYSSVCFQDDGNLVIYQLDPVGKRCEHPIWSSGTDNHPDGASLEFQGDGNLVIYSPGHQATKFQTKTAGKSAQKLTLGGDCNLVLRDDDRKTVWQSNSKCSANKCTRSPLCGVVAGACHTAMVEVGEIGSVGGCLIVAGNILAAAIAGGPVGVAGGLVLFGLFQAACISAVSAGSVFTTHQCVEALETGIKGGCQ